MCTIPIKTFFNNHGLRIVHLLQVLILSLSLPLFDYIREWMVISKCYATKNFAWGSLFLFPVLQSGIAYYVIWYSEEIKRRNFSLCGIKHWTLRTWVTLCFAPIYAIVRSFVLIYQILTKKVYKPEKLRISKRLVPIELFYETLPQLLILNYVLSGIIENCADCEEIREIIQGTTFASDLRKNIYTFSMKSSTIINQTFSNIIIDSQTMIYSKEEVEIIKDQMGYLVVAWNLLIISSVFGLIFFLLEGPVPSMIIPTTQIDNKRPYAVKQKVSPVGMLIESEKSKLEKTTTQPETVGEFYVSLFKRILGVIIDLTKGVYYLLVLVVKSVNRCNPIFGMLRLISQFTIILSVSHISENSRTDLELRAYLWLRVLIFLLLNFLPAITIQYLALLKPCMKGRSFLGPFSYLIKFPFLFFVPVYTGILYTLDTSQKLKLENRKTHCFEYDILRVSVEWRNIFQIVRATLTTTMLLVIFFVQSLKTHHPEHVFYICLVNLIEIIIVIGHLLISWKGRYFCSDTFQYKEGFQIDYDGSVSPTTFFHLCDDHTYQLTWEESLVSFNSKLFNNRLQNKLHLVFLYKSPGKNINHDAIKNLNSSVLSDQYQRKGYFMPFTSPSKKSLNKKWATTDEYFKEHYWHQWIPRDGADKIELGEFIGNNHTLMFANEDYAFLPMSEDDIIHHFDSGNHKRLKDIITDLGLKLKHFSSGDQHYLDEKIFVKEQNGMLNMEIKNEWRYRYLDKYSARPYGNFISRAYSVYCPISIVKGKFNGLCILSYNYFEQNCSLSC